MAADLGKPLTVERIRIEEAYAGRVRRFEFQYRDGETWKTIFTGTQLGQWFQKRFAPVTAREFRLNILEASEGPTIADIELFENSRMKVLQKVCLLCLAAAGCVFGAGSPVDRFNVVWDSPSADHHGSMPVGNGDVAVNAWMTREGDLHLYIAKTDAWDDNARLVKVGKLRLHFEPNPIAAGQPFRQELRLREGSIEITPGRAGECRIRLWVDANHPVIHITADTAIPVEGTAFIELWRTNRYEVTELQVSDVMMNRKAADKQQDRTIVEPDTILAGQTNRSEFHTRKSVVPGLCDEGCGFPQLPLSHRTLGRGNGEDGTVAYAAPLAARHLPSLQRLCPHPASRVAQGMARGDG